MAQPMTYEQRFEQYPGGDCPHCPSRLFVPYLDPEEGNAGVLCAGCGCRFMFEDLSALEIRYKGMSFKDPAS